MKHTGHTKNTENIGLIEDLRTEFKSDVKKLSEETIVEAVVALANTEGGTLYIGVEDDGTITGVHKNHQSTAGLSAMIFNRTVPNVSVSTDIMYSFTKPIISIAVPKSYELIYTSSGRALQRRLKGDGTPENYPMFLRDIRRYMVNAYGLDVSAYPVLDATFDDLSLLEFERMRSMISKYRGDQSLLELDNLKLAQALQLVQTVDDTVHPTMAGLILLGKGERIRDLIPTAESAFTMMKGTKLIRNVSEHIPALQAIERCIESLDLVNMMTELFPGPVAVRLMDIDPISFREALVNAYSHRDYTEMGRIRVDINDEQISITSPGDFMQGITPNSVLFAEPRSRNTVLADAFKRIGLAEKTGRGVDKIIEPSLFAGRPIPRYDESTSTYVRVVFDKAPVDDNFVTLIVQNQVKSNMELSLRGLMVLYSIRKLKQSNIDDIIRDCQLSPAICEMNVKQLLKMNIIQSVDMDGKQLYYLNTADYVYRLHGTSQVYDVTPTYGNPYIKAFHSLLNAVDQVTRTDVANALGISKPQAYRLIMKLFNKGILEKVGNGKYTSYKYTDTYVAEKIRLERMTEKSLLPSI